MIDKQKAKDIAIQECLARGWVLSEPIKVYRRLFHYQVWGNADRIGANTIVCVRRRDGKVTKASVAPF